MLKIVTPSFIPSPSCAGTAVRRSPRMMAAAAAALIAMCLLLTGCDGAPDSGDSPQVRESVSQKETEQAAPEEAPQPAAEQDDAQEEADRAAQEAAAQEAEQAAQEAAAQEAANQAAQEAAAQEAADRAAQEAAAQEEAQEQAPTSVYYANCAAVRAAGAAPLYEGDPGYRSQLDRDHDGVACE